MIRLPPCRRLPAALLLAGLLAPILPAWAQRPGDQAIPAGAYAVIAEVRARPGQADALRAATLPLIAQVRAEPGNRVYFLQEDRAAPGRFVFYEIFASQADFEAHNATPHVQAWFARLPELAEGGVTVTRLEVLAAPR